MQKLFYGICKSCSFSDMNYVDERMVGDGVSISLMKPNQVTIRCRLVLYCTNTKSYEKSISYRKNFTTIIIEMFYLNSTLNFGILPVLVFHLEVYYKLDRLLTGLTAQQKGATARWYLNKTFSRPIGR